MRHYKKTSLRLQKSTSHLWSSFFLILLLCFSCKESESESNFDPHAAVEVSQIVPETGKMSLPLIIHGKNFGTDKSKIKVLFDNVEAVIISAKNEHLYVLNPKQHGGEHTVKVIVDGKEGVLATKFTYIAVASVSTVAGTGEKGTTDGAPLESKFTSIDYLSVDNKNNLIVTDNRQTIRLISLEDNKVTPILKNGDELYGSCFSPDYSKLYLAREVKNQLGYQFDCGFNWESTVINGGDLQINAATVVTDEYANVYFIGTKGDIVKMDVGTQLLTKMGTIPTKLYGRESDYYAAYNRRDGYIYITLYSPCQIIRVNVKKDLLTDSDFEVYAGEYGVSKLVDGPRLEANFSYPRGLACDSEGNLYVADGGNDAIRKITPEGIVTTLTGGKNGSKDGTLEEATFYEPRDIAIDPDDIIYVADTKNYKIRRIAIQ